MGSLFVREVVARLKGDDAEVLAIKNERKAESAFKVQIAVLEASLVSKEETLAIAKEAFANALYPQTQITLGETYLDGICKAQEAIDAAQEDLDNTNASIEYFKKLAKTAFSPESKASK